MSKYNKLFLYACSALAVMIIAGCGSDDSTTPASSYSYSTTSSIGDYSEWTLTGGVLNATWNVVNTLGDIDYTHTMAATCGSPDSFGARVCTITSSSCADAASFCPANVTGSFDLMDVPGVALYVNADLTGTPQLHVGFAKESACAADVSGDYTMIHTGLGLDENFGVYRSDATFETISHADFGFATADANFSDQSVAYTTGTAAETLAVVGASCTDGVRSRLAGGGYTIRSMMTQSGLFVADLPAGQGGLISFKTSTAAVLADFAGKSFGGISFPDNGAEESVKADFGAVAASGIDLTATVGTEVQSLNIKALATASAPLASGPEYPDFTVAPAAYATKPLSGISEYPTPASIPGLFKLDGLSDDGRVVLAAMKFNSKVIAVGMVYNYRDVSEINPSTGVAFIPGLYNTGNFLLFEK